MTMFNAKVFWKFEIFELSENLRKLCVSTKFQYQEIKWNFGIVCSCKDGNTYLKFILDLLIIFYGYFKVIIVSHLNLSNLGLSSTQVRILVQAYSQWVQLQIRVTILYHHLSSSLPWSSSLYILWQHYVLLRKNKLHFRYRVLIFLQ